MALTVALGQEDYPAVVRPSNLRLPGSAGSAPEDGPLPVVRDSSRLAVVLQDVYPSLPKNHARRVFGRYGNEPSGVRRPGNCPHAIQLSRQAFSHTTLGIDHIGLGEGRQVPVPPATGDKGDLRTVRRPDRPVVVPVASRNLQHLAGLHLRDEQVVVGVTPPSLQVVSEADAVDLHHPRAVGLGSRRRSGRRLRVGAEDDAGAVRRPDEVLHPEGSVRELPGFPTVGANHPDLPRLSGLSRPQETDHSAVRREPGRTVGPALRELPAAILPRAGHHQAGAVLRRLADSLHPGKGIYEALAVRRNHGVGSALELIDQVGGEAHYIHQERKKRFKGIPVL